MLRMASDIVGLDVARLHEMAHTHRCSWGAARTLAAPYLVDHDKRFVTVDGRLDLLAYYHAISDGLTEIIYGAGVAGPICVVIPFQRGTALCGTDG